MDAALQTKPPSARPAARRPRRGQRIALAVALYLAVESLLPAAAQPSAWVLRGLIAGYRATLSKPMGRVVTCKFRPTCSQYGLESIEKHGTVVGFVRTVARLCRCSPWGPAPGEDLP